MFHPLQPIRAIPVWTLAASVWAFSAVAAANPEPPPIMPDPIAPDHAGSAGELFTESFFLTLGFSFMIGLAMGFALKVAFKIALLVIGLMLLGVFGLQYAGLVDINWSGVEAHYDGWMAWLGAFAGVFFAFVGDNLTSGASFLAGLALGLKY
ncbi:FUN14 domain-containing protein [Thiocystis violascens]|uniref:FUN14 family protein n=1 Tax=Thiocystis violascens (strain ATCC 17096 / DSM 198 / 6111) TaxID=765911 RepID=I3YEL4_THIV6|nr:FUN14 domain-containing protein [Thiocystis violascens]AFL75432.1 hypothetical protein Thivi_3569 [Thiocystis violascens DSM 198]